MRSLVRRIYVEHEAKPVSGSIFARLSKVQAGSFGRRAVLLQLGILGNRAPSPLPVLRFTDPKALKPKRRGPPSQLLHPWRSSASVGHSQAAVSPNCL